MMLCDQNVWNTFTARSEEYLEMGAQWLHGDQGNPLYEELSKLGLIAFQGDYLDDGLPLLGLYWLLVRFNSRQTANACLTCNLEK